MSGPNTQEKKSASVTVRLNRRLGPYIADTGRAAFGGVVGFMLLTAIAEIVYPGLVTNWISPGSLIGLAVLTGILALWPSDRQSVNQSSKRLMGQLKSLVLAILLGLGAWLAAWQYFASLASERIWLSLASGLVAGIAAWLLSSDYDRTSGN